MLRRYSGYVCCRPRLTPLMMPTPYAVWRYMSSAYRTTPSRHFSRSPPNAAAYSAARTTRQLAAAIICPIYAGAIHATALRYHYASSHIASAMLRQHTPQRNDGSFSPFVARRRNVRAPRVVAVALYAA